MTLRVLACREGSAWVVQAIEQDVAAQGTSLLGALEDLGQQFDARDAILVAETNVAPLASAPVEYEQALRRGDYVGILPLGAVRVAQVYIGSSPYAQKAVEEACLSGCHPRHSK